MPKGLPILLLTLLLTGYRLPAAQSAPEQAMYISGYELKENLIKNGKLAIVALDSSHQPLEEINGTFQFIINGFKQSLSFHDGVGITPNPIEHSTFVYLQHENDLGSFNELFYVLKKDSSLKIVRLNWKILLAIPLILLVFVMLFKRFLWFAVILLIIYLYYTSQHGLELPQLLQIITSGVKGLLS